MQLLTMTEIIARLGSRAEAANIIKELTGYAISPSTIGRIERGECKAGIDHLTRYALTRFLTDERKKVLTMSITPLFQVDDHDIESFTDENDVNLYEMVTFNLITDMGIVRLSENLNRDDEGNITGVERVESNILMNQSDELASVFDMRDHLGLQPIDDYLPFDEIITEVENMIFELRKKSGRGRLK
ncbi:hypothetical protein BZG76_06005 [Salinivibrio sp. AR647]|nr:hypothetical protein BZG76_06005 [Salinivibrio sp. AR647]